MNKVIKIIDLLNMIAEGKEMPNKIKYKEDIFCYDVFNKNYCTEDEEKFNFLKILPYYVGYKLNDTVEIIEEDNNKIENLPKWATTREDKEYTKQEDHILVVAQKVDEIIDKINNME